MLIKNNWRYQNEDFRRDRNSDMKAHDVGFGGHPFSIATHLADKYTEETSHRIKKFVKDNRLFFSRYREFTF